MNEDQAPKKAAALPNDGGKTRVLEPGDATLRLVRVLDQYMADLQAGGHPDRAGLIGAHPDLAPQLEQALAGLEFIHCASGPPEKPPVELGDFKILREVGRGGMGVVYEAEQRSLKRRVALKVLRFGAVADELAMQRFQREVETVARLHHTNIVPIFAVGREREVRYYAMQFIDGRNLSELAEENRVHPGRFTFRDIADWGLQAAEALDHAHQRGVIHRDIKPSNLIRDDEGRIWLTDFGLARRVDDVTLSVAGALLGTPRYMSPEQAGAATRPVDHRTDIYSLGATLYELAARRPIFEASSPHEVMSLIIHREPRPMREHAPEVPRDLETIVLKCLSKDPAHRYSAARSLADDLRAFLDNRPIQARPPSLPERVVRWVRKHRHSTAVAAVSTALSLALTVGVYLGWRGYHKARLGALSLKSSTAGLVAEILDLNDRIVLPSFTVPTPQPLSVPAGTYRLRLSASGLPSETWPLDIARGRHLDRDVALHPPWLWPPGDVNLVEYPETQAAELDRGGTSLIVLTHLREDRAGRQNENRIRRLNGANRQPFWPEDFIFNEQSLPPGGSLDEWTRLLSPSGVVTTDHDSRLLLPAPDLDGDDVGDLVWSSWKSPSLVAISGATGRLLWWFRSHPPIPGSTDTTGARLIQGGSGALIGWPAQRDIDEDGTIDLVACFHSQSDHFKTVDGQSIRTGSHSWMAAVSGRTGRELWRHPLGDRWGGYASDSTKVERFGALCRPHIGLRQGRSIIALILDDQWLALDLKTGREAWAAQALDFQPKEAPSVADVDGDGSSEALFARRHPSEPAAMELVCVPLGQSNVLWKTTFHPVYQGHEYKLDQGKRPWFLLEDLNGDGQQEIAVSQANRLSLHPNVRLAGLQVLRGATGKPLWERRIWLERFFSADVPFEQWTTGPDLDGDGYRELYLAWMGQDAQARPKRMQLWVAAVSGGDGRMLWRSALEAVGPTGPLVWGPADQDLLPQLLVPNRSGPGGKPLTFFLRASDGRLTRILPDVFEPLVRDFNGDGISDLYYTVSPQGVPRRMIVAGTPPQPWRRLGGWKGVQDMDRDGFADLASVEEGQLTLRSGRDERLVWTAQAEFSHETSILVPPLPGGDLDRDGTPDVIAPVATSTSQGPGYPTRYGTLAAFSGRDGRQLWLAADFRWGHTSGSSSGALWSYEYPAMHWLSLKPQGPADIAAVNVNTNGDIQLNIIGSDSGQLRWQSPIVSGGFAVQPSPRRPSALDGNGDGMGDLPLWVPEETGKGRESACRLTLRSGLDGHPLWAATDLRVEHSSKITWPEPAVGDLDGDGLPEVIVTLNHGYDRQKSHYACDLAVVDGRSGQVRWTWTWQTGFPEIWPPVILSRGPAKPGLLCLGVKESEKAGLFVFDATGQVRRRIPLQTDRVQFGSGNLLWRPADLDGDGAEELLYYNSGQWCAAGGDNLDLLWARNLDLPTQGGQWVDYRPAGTGSASMAVLWTGLSVYGLIGTNGHCAWRAELPQQPPLGLSQSTHLRFLEAGLASASPRVQFLWNARTDQDWSSTCRQSWPTSPDGRYHLPKPAPKTYEALPEPPAP